MQDFAIGLCGWGVVGGGVVELLHAQADLIARRCDRRVVLKTIAERDPAVARRRDAHGAQVVDDARQVLDDPAIHLVIELIGGTKAAREVATGALQRGKHLVTANKALLAHHGDELFALASRHGVGLGFEASVGGGIPIIHSLRDGFAANPLQGIYGILNGTCNYILTRMEEDHLPFGEALAQAQKLGYAEADPTLDIEGTDTAHKLVLLARLAFGRHLPLDSVEVEGVSKISAEDIRTFRHLGLHVRLLGAAMRQERGITLRVAPTLVEDAHPLAGVRENFNAIWLLPLAAGPSLLVGKGAGATPTASAILADVIDLATSSQVRSAEEHFFRSADTVSVLDPGTEVTAGYARFATRDQPGVLAAICSCLSRHGISVQAVFQAPSQPDTLASIELTTHPCPYGHLRQAVDEIDHAGITHRPTLTYRLMV